MPGLVDSGTTRIILGHISEENNTMPLALHTAKRALTDAGIRLERDCELAAAGRCGLGKMYII